MSYQVWVNVNGHVVPISREFEHENEAQEWALDLDPARIRGVRRVEEED